MLLLSVLLQNTKRSDEIGTSRQREDLDRTNVPEPNLECKTFIHHFFGHAVHNSEKNVDKRRFRWIWCGYMALVLLAPTIEGEQAHPNAEAKWAEI